MKNYNSALITGGAQRIGASILEYLAKRKFKIVAQYNKSESEVKLIKKKLNEYNLDLHFMKYDFENLNKLEGFFKSAEKKIGKFDVLINNASSFEFDTIRSTDFKKFDLHINVNLKAPYFLSKYFAKSLGKKKEGLIINLLDQRVKNITPYFTSYTVSKYGLYALTKSLALNLAPNIRVNAIAPGPTLQSKNQTKSQFNSQVLRTPLMKQVKLDEINESVGYLINNMSVTGQVLTLDSGQSLGWSNTRSKKFEND